MFSGDIRNLTSDEIEVAFKDVPNFTLQEEKNIVDVLVDFKIASSKREAREFIINKSISINGEKVSDLDFIVSKSFGIDNKYVVIRRGKKKYFLIKFER